MYEGFFNLTEPPFQLVPNAKYFFASAKHKRALDCLKFGLMHGEGFVVVSGEVGAGKTTLIAHLLSTLHQSKFVTATVVTTQVNADDLLHLVAEGFQIGHENCSKAILLTRLQSHFERIVARNAMPIIIVDEAQNLPMDSLEELRMLSNFKFGQKSSLLTVLAGQPQFRDKMRHPDLLQLRQRVVVSYHLGPLSLQETGEYVRYRLAQAGCNNLKIAEDVFPMAFQVTGGVPRLINLLFNRTLLHVYLEERREVLARDIEIVANELRTEGDGWAPAPSPLPKPTLRSV